jgi:hypothetical protein
MTRTDTPMMDLTNSTVHLDIFKATLKEIKNNPHRARRIIDSFAPEQFAAKKVLVDMIHTHTILDLDTELMIFGSWYGGILVPSLAHLFTRTTCIDLDDEVIQSAKTNLLRSVPNVEYMSRDIFDLPEMSRFPDVGLVINTSCEHMRPMKEWPWWHRFRPGLCWAFQSNNMDYLDEHTNCVHSLDEFSSQLPANFIVTGSHELRDPRGVRYTLVGNVQ